MNKSIILNIVSRFLFPFMVMFGIYIIINGDKSVGGGFQGGVILASSYLVHYFIVNKHPFTIADMLKIDKYLFLILIFIITLSIFTKQELFTNFFPLDFDIKIRRIYLEILNVIIGIKVSVGFVALFYIFIEEGNS